MAHRSAPAVAVAAAPHPLAQASNFRWRKGVGMIVFHLIALLAVFPQFFTVSGLVVAIIGRYLFGTLGINVGFHRLIAHRAFKAPVWLERSLAVLGTCSLQNGVIRWVGEHRMHHGHSDQPGDPHSPHAPTDSFFWGHWGWLFFFNPDSEDGGYQRYAKDLVRQPFYMAINRYWQVIFFAHAALIFLAGAVWGGSWLTGLSWLIWGVFVRVVVLWHVTWAVNSVCHLWGQRPHNTEDRSTNNAFVALLSDGEGWHNNHHACPRSAAHGFRWWEFDMSFCFIRVFSWLGLARSVEMPPGSDTTAAAGHRR